MDNQSKSKENNDLLNNQTQDSPPRPDTVHDLKVMFQSHLNKFREQPAGFDINPQIAAKQWVQLQDPPGFGERPELKKPPHGGSTWNTPYLDRLKRDLWKFFQLSRENQKLIVDAKTTYNVTWRGESIELFKTICTQMG